MTKSLYPKGKEKMLAGQVAWDTAVIKVHLVTGDYAYSAAHEFLSDVGANTVGSAQTLAGKTITDGVFDSDDITFPSLTAGSTCAGIAMFLYTGNPATSPLLYYSNELTNFPKVTDGGDITVRVDNGPTRWFSL